ncbi:hypothetical protein L1D14_04235 [Vibrio tubiashii]|uniref:hypothetical protein n=1 Tax=Vibrio tubiashii TaxID=29498 RepID=UPI001EFCAE9D|nr:hypothetical protein [Vibrio tubiashii]MCG9575440.1 hypothetical protein [Vibrio tubiashii]
MFLYSVSGFMGCIRYKHNNGKVLLSSEGLLHGSKAITRNTIPALLNSGEQRFLPYGGFLSVDRTNTAKYQFVKLVGIDAYSYDRSGLSDWVNVPDNTYVVGCYVNGRYYLAFFDGAIKATPFTKPSNRYHQAPPNNVHPIFGKSTD